MNLWVIQMYVLRKVICAQVSLNNVMDYECELKLIK